MKLLIGYLTQCFSFLICAASNDVGKWRWL